MKLLLPALIILSFCGYSAAEQDFSSSVADISRQIVAPQDNTRVAKHYAPVTRIKPASQPGSASYLFKLYGKDYNKHADWHMNLLSMYRHGNYRGVKPGKASALTSIRALSMLGAGPAPLVSGDTLFWLPRQLSDAMKYGADKEVRGSAALALGVVLAGKPANYAKPLLDDLAFTVSFDREEFEVRRFAVMALAASGQKYAVNRLTDCARRSSAAHDFIGRGKFRYEEDESSWSLESSIIKALGAMVSSKDASAEARGALRYFANLTQGTCGDYTVIKLPDDKGIDESLLVNARLTLAQGGGIGRRGLSSNGDNPETGTVKCLLPVINAGDSCGLRRTAAGLFREIHGDVISAKGSYVEGKADCSELMTNKVMLEFTKIYLTGLGTGLLVKGAITASVNGLRVVAGLQNAAKVAQYEKFMKMGFEYYEKAEQMKAYTEYMKAARESAK